MYNVVLTFPVQQSDSDIHIHACVCVYMKRMCVYIYTHPFRNLFHFSLYQGIKYSFMCYMVGPCCLSILYIIVCIY